MIVGRYPLSFGQWGLWFVQELRDTPGLYRDREVFRLSGQLNLQALSKAVDLLVSRHEILRTRFVTLGGEPLQVVDDRWRGETRVERGSLEGPHDDQVDAFIKTVRERPLDLTQGPLFRVDVLSLGETDFILAFTMHHLITDGWSVRWMLEEISRSYAAVNAGQAPPLLAPPRQYGEFAIWQQATLQGAELDALLGYWTEHVKGAPTELDLRGSRSSAPTSPQAETIRLDISESAVDRLRSFARSRGATLFMALLAVFDIVIAQASRTTDLLIGVPVAGRTAAEFEESLGFFVNLLALRVSLRDDPTSAELMRRVRGVVLGGLAHQDLPFNHLVASINPRRSPDVHPLVQVAIQLIEAPFDSALRLGGTDVAAAPVGPDETAYALMLELHHTDDGLQGRLTFAPCAVAPDVAHAIADGFALLVESLPASPERAVSELMALLPTGDTRCS